MERQHEGIIQTILETPAQPAPGPVDVPRAPKKQAYLSVYHPSLRERIGGAAADFAEEYLGADRYDRQYIEDKVGTLAEVAPLVGTIVAGDEIYRDLKAGRWGSAAINTGLGVAAAAVPLARPIARKLGKTAFGRSLLHNDELPSLDVASTASPTRADELPELAPRPSPEHIQFDRPPAQGVEQLDLAARPEVPHRDLQRYVPPNGPSHRILAATSNPKVRERLLEAIDEGLALGARGWLDTDEIFQRFVRELGPERGFKDYMELLDKIAATSPLSDPGTNIRSASYYFTQHGREGLLDPAVKNPNPHGHIAAGTHKKILAGSPEGGGFDSVKAPKVSAMAENMKGNPQPVMIDTRLMRLLGSVSEDPRFLNRSASKRVHEGKMSMKEAFSKPANFDSRPRDDEYGHFERYVQDLARERGLTPLDVHLALWLREAAKQRPHHRPEDFRSFMDHFNHRIRLTAQKRGMAEEEVWRQLIRRENPLLVLPAAAVGAGVLADDSLTEPPNEWMSGGGPAP